jgi:DUF4097 and DUF4098 domain-containing protein YvlB
MQLTSGRLAAVVIGIPMTLALAVFGAFNLVGTFARTSEQHTANYAWQGGAISVKTSAGTIRIQVGTGTRVGVTYTEHYELRKPTVAATMLNGGLQQLTASCPGGVFGNNCEINYVVTVPASASLVLHTGDGDVHLAGTTGTISVDTGDGDVDGTQLHTKTVNASTGDGDIQLEWDAAPTDVEATTGDGDISLVVPQGSGPYKVSAHTGDGGTHVTVPQDQSATASITADTGDGGIRISPAS